MSESLNRSAQLQRVVAEVARRRAEGESVSHAEILASHPELMPELAERLQTLDLVAGAVARGLQASADTAVSPISETTGSGGVADSAPLGRAEEEFAPDCIPGFEVLREIHRGGQGVVYLAVQKSTKRRVAIKVMREGPFAGAADRARFEREVQILGQLQHPNIVAIHDSGTAAGNFYYVMDYIRGQALDEYMAGSTRTIEETLRLFAKICAAVNAAHLRGVIHRDLKPGNIRVDPAGEPHILDFGLAKVSAYDPIGEGASPVMTMTGQFVGSLPWASPEQAGGDARGLDVRTDVYSLGVVLYEMLTGRFPYEVAGNIRDVLDRILRAEPARPSTIRKRIDDEVETIVLKCLSKERERRYQTAGELARDIDRYLNGEAIEAKRDSGWYVLKKTLARHRALVHGTTAVVLLTLAAAIWLGLLYRTQSRLRGEADAQRRIADAQRDQARSEATRARAVEQFMRGMLAAANREVGDAEVRVSDLLDAAAGQAPQRFADQPLVEAAVRNMLGLSYRALGALDRAEEQLRAAVAIYDEHDGAADADVIAARGNVALLLKDRGRLAEAEEALRGTLDAATHALGRRDAQTLVVMSNLASVLRARRKLDEAEALYRERFPEADPAAGLVDDADVLALNNYAGLLVIRRRFTDAARVLAAVDAAAERLLRPDDPARVQIMNNWAALRLREGRLREAAAHLEQAAASAARVHTDGHPDLLRIERERASVAIWLGNWADADAALTRTLEWHQRMGRGDSADALLVATDLGALRLQQGRNTEAAELLTSAAERAAHALGARDLVTLMATFELANLRLATGESAAAETLCRQTLELRREERVYGPRHPETLRSMHQLGLVLGARGAASDAEAQLHETLRVAEEVFAVDHFLLAGFRADYGAALARLERWAPAETALRTAHEVLSAALGRTHPRSRAAAAALVEVYTHLNRNDEVEFWRRSAEAPVEQAPSSSQPKGAP